MFDAIGDAINGWFNSGAESLFNVVANLWNFFVKTAYGLLEVTPQNFSEGAPWAIIESLYPYFVAVGSSLVGLFFLISFCRESVDIRAEFRLETAFKQLIRLVLSEWLVTNTLPIMKQVFAIAVEFTKWVKHGYPTLTLTTQWADTLEQGNGLVNIFLILLLFLFALVSGILLLYMVYSRFFKLFVIIPFAPLALSTVAGSGGLTHSASSWVKSFLAHSLEVVVIAIALALSGAVVSASSIFPTQNGTYGAMLSIANMAFTMLLTAGAVKGAEETIRKALGL